MKKDRISQTALKVALSNITLSIKDDWAQRLPPKLVEITEQLLLASGSPGYGPGLMRASRKPWMISVYEIQDQMMPGQWEGFGHRKIFMNEQVERAIKDGARQVLVLGAGFDSLCLRLAPKYPDVHFFEVDHPATSVAKSRGVALVGQPENMTQIAVDLGQASLSKVLTSDGRWDATQFTALVAEGLLMYLKDEEVHNLFKEAAACTPSGSRFMFSHAIPEDRKVLQLMLRIISEPLRSAVSSEDLPNYIRPTAWTVVSDVDTNKAHGIERYGVAERN
ncbi:MAG: SAM-dependent methyltransferase [Pseudomonadales bacterium]|jgi:methyltransferase (TIGR00027 family)